MLTQRMRSSGFTLIELAIVLLIVGLLTSTLLGSLSTQREAQQRREADRSLEEIRQLLLGFAAANGRLPCPDTDSDPAAAGYGVEEASCSSDLTAEAYLPWKTLGLGQGFDPWGGHRQAALDPDNGRWRYRVDRNYAIAPITLNTAFSADALSIQNSAGAALTTTTERPVAIIWSTGPNGAANGGNSSFEATAGIYTANVATTSFDDFVVWLARPLLMANQSAAGWQIK